MTPAEILKRWSVPNNPGCNPDMDRRFIQPEKRWRLEEEAKMYKKYEEKVLRIEKKEKLWREKERLRVEKGKTLYLLDSQHAEDSPTISDNGND